MRKIIILYVFLFLSFFIQAQETFYYYKGEKIPLTLNKERVSFRASATFNKTELTRNNLLEIATFEDDTKGGTTLFTVAILPNQYEAQIKQISALKGVTGVFPSFKNEAGQQADMTDYLYIKLKKEGDYEQLKKLVDDEKLQLIGQNKFMPLWYTVKLPAHFRAHTLAFANKTYETGWFAAVETDFMSDDRLCVNDPQFAQQWALKNTGQNGGMAGVDMKACDAWNISKGENIIVAVVDQGIQLNHEDLAANIHSSSFNSETGTSPSQVFGDHGSHCAGIIGAVQNNNKGISGIAPKSKLMSVSNSLAGTPTSRMKRADGINWAWQNGAAVITNSWGSSIMYTVIDDAINNALTQGRNGKGSVVLFATGNDYGAVGYPAKSNPKILAVGANTRHGLRASFSNYGTELDVVAPGEDIYSTLANNNYGNMSGTSMATPYVAGVAALILAVNPALSEQEVRNIIESTARKIRNDQYSYSTSTGRTNGTWNTQMGYGMVDAFAAVTKAKETVKLDLYMKNTMPDTGIEPDVVSGNMLYNSPDIWIRNADDGGLIAENPEYDPIRPNYVYVRVRNRSQVASSGQESLKLHWAKAGTSLMWPTYWDGNLNYNGLPMGGIIGTKNIPVIQPGQSVIVKFPWKVPDPQKYQLINPEPWHFCLVGRILSDEDPMTVPEGFDLGLNVKHNNNIAWKNLTVVDLQPNRPIGGVVLITNPFPTERKYHLQLLDTGELGSFIMKEAEVKITLSESIYNAWLRGGKRLVEMKELEERTFLVSGTNARLENLVFAPNEMGTANLTFNFLTQNVTDQREFLYHLVQLNAENQSLIGGEAYLVRKNQRALFHADAGDDLQINRNEEPRLSAQDIGEPATYNWFDQEGNFVHEGLIFQPQVDSNKKFKLEVTAKADGYKDYDEVSISINPNKLNVIAPNPATSTITVGYAINNGQRATLSILPLYGGTPGNGTNYSLDIDAQQVQIDLSGYANGLYKVILYCDGNFVASESLVIHR